MCEEPDGEGDTGSCMPLRVAEQPERYLVAVNKCDECPFLVIDNELETYKGGKYHGLGSIFRCSHEDAFCNVKLRPGRIPVSCPLPKPETLDAYLRSKREQEARKYHLKAGKDV